MSINKIDLFVSAFKRIVSKSRPSPPQPSTTSKTGDTIILEAGTTIPALAQLLKEQVKSVFIITCSVPVALELSSAGYDILLLGGMVRNKSLALLGRETLAILERYRADKAFVGSSGFTAGMGHSTPNPEDAQI